MTSKRLANTHLQFIQIEDNFAKSFGRNKNFQNFTTDGKEQSKDFTGEKVNLKHFVNTDFSGDLGFVF